MRTPAPGASTSLPNRKISVIVPLGEHWHLIGHSSE